MLPSVVGNELQQGGLLMSEDPRRRSFPAKPPISQIAFARESSPLVCMPNKSSDILVIDTEGAPILREVAVVDGHGELLLEAQYLRPRR